MEYDFFHKTTAFTHTMYFFKIRRNGFRRKQNGILRIGRVRVFFWSECRYDNHRSLPQEVGVCVVKEIIIFPKLKVHESLVIYGRLRGIFV